MMGGGNDHSELRIGSPSSGTFHPRGVRGARLVAADLAYILGVPDQSVTMIVNGKRGISPEMAKALGKAFEVAADFFANLQMAFEMANAREPDTGVARRARLQAIYPVREIIRRGWLADGEIGALEAQMTRLFGVSDPGAIPHMAHAAKKTSYDDVPAAQLAWLFRVRQIASEMVLPPYSEQALREALPHLRQLLPDPEAARHVPRIMAECGVRFVMVETLPGAKIDGVCFWLNDAAPVISLSMRHDRIDNFWFVLRHEIEHVLQKHGRQTEMIDAELEGENASASDRQPAEERMANIAAAHFCVPAQEMDSFFIRKTPFFAERDVLGFAKRVHVHPGLVVGQIQSRLRRYDLLRKHLVRIRQHVAPSALVDGWGQTRSDFILDEEGRLATYSEQLQKVWHEYERVHGNVPATARDAVKWGVAQGLITLQG